MQDVIRKIISVDEQARKMTDDASKKRLECEAEIATSKAEMRQTYMERVKKKTEAHRDSEKKKAEKKLEQFSEQNKKSIDMLEKKYEENVGYWVDQIVERTLGR